MLIGVAIYFVLPQLEHTVGKLGFLAGLTAITAGLLLGFLEHGTYTKAFNWIRKIIGLLLVILGIYWIQGAMSAKKSEINWVHYNNQTIDTLLEAEKPIFIDFYADWCAPCKQLDSQTFTDKDVTETAELFTMLKVDCTKPDAAIQAFMDTYKVTGMPTLIFISASGIELEELREIGFLPPDKFLASMLQTLKTN